VNDEVVHGIPGARTLQEGDIISFDVGVTVAEMIADGAATFEVGSVSQDARELMRVTREALHQGIAQAKPGNRVYDISRAVQLYVEAYGCSVVRKLVGHGVGHAMHEPPHIPNFVDGAREDSPELTPGMTLAIEPMVNLGGYQVVQDRDRWTYRTKDRSLSAHFEHTIALTVSGCEVLTLRADVGRTLSAPAGGDEELAPQAPVGGSQ
jgi:methionyl aminopeptidase